MGEPFFTNTPRSYHYFGVAGNITEMLIVAAGMMIVRRANDDSYRTG